MEAKQMSIKETETCIPAYLLTLLCPSDPPILCRFNPIRRKSFKQLLITIIET